MATSASVQPGWMVLPQLAPIPQPIAPAADGSVTVTLTPQQIEFIREHCQYELEAMGADSGYRKAGFFNTFGWCQAETCDNPAVQRCYEIDGPCIAHSHTESIVLCDDHWSEEKDEGRTKCGACDGKFRPDSISITGFRHAGTHTYDRLRYHVDCIVVCAGCAMGTILFPSVRPACEFTKIDDKAGYGVLCSICVPIFAGDVMYRVPPPHESGVRRTGFSDLVAINKK